MGTGAKLVIVESPAKAKTIGKYLGDDFKVLASVGHIRDLIEPKNLPADLKKGSLGKFSIDIENNFEPYYVVSSEKKKTVSELKKALKTADELFLATDGDREGEAIAWHLMQELKPKVPVHRMVFNEITKDAITAAKNHTRQIDSDLVDAQETRRILDRLYGYEVSPVLWRKVGPGLSAGRVQSAATRLIVDRERQRMAFVAAQYWDVVATVSPHAGGSSFDAKLVSVNGAKIAQGRDFDDKGTLKTTKNIVVDGPLASKLAAALNEPDAKLVTESVDAKPYKRSPAAPFTTSTLQQEASRKLRYTARQTMSIAQRLYENGYITYMRTDSATLSDQAITAARSQATELYGPESVPNQPRRYKGNSKNAQEAHEAIRPAGATFRLPKSLHGVLTDQELKLYKLIWRRTVASQMINATGSTVTLQLGFGPISDGTTASFSASGTVIAVRGFLDAYDEDRDDVNKGARDVILPKLSVGQTLSVDSAEAKQHETTPPARFTEASLVKELESLGIGRPSTYAAIISTIQDRGYVREKGQALIPNWIAFSVVRLLEDYFGNLVDYEFTAKMEDDLDQIAAGTEDRVNWLNGFYFGADHHAGLKGVIENLGEIDARAINSTKLTDNVTLRIGRYGPYLEEAGDPPRRVNIPEGMAPDELTPERAQEIIDAPVVQDRVLGKNPASGHDVVVKDGRFGPYVTEVLPEGEEWPKGQKAPTASLFKAQTVEGVTLDDALRLLSLPRTVGDHPEDGEPITAQNGRYGPYLKHGTDTRKLPSEEAIFTIDVPGSLELFAQPKYGNRTAAAALKEFDADPVSGKPIKIKDGRFGPYVTDGTTNVTVPRGTEPTSVTFDQAVEMLAVKRAKGPVKRKTTRKTTAKKSTAKKKPAAKKTTTKKAATKKATANKPATKKPAAKKSAEKE